MAGRASPTIEQRRALVPTWMEGGSEKENLSSTAAHRRDSTLTTMSLASPSRVVIRTPSVDNRRRQRVLVCERLLQFDWTAWLKHTERGRAHRTDAAGSRGCHHVKTRTQ